MLLCFSWKDAPIIWDCKQTWMIYCNVWNVRQDSMTYVTFIASKLINYDDCNHFSAGYCNTCLDFPPIITCRCHRSGNQCRGWLCRMRMESTKHMWWIVKHCITSDLSWVLLRWVHLAINQILIHTHLHSVCNRHQLQAYHRPHHSTAAKALLPQMFHRVLPTTFHHQRGM